MDETQSRTLEDHRRLACHGGTGPPVKEAAGDDEHRTIVLFISAAGETVRPIVIFPLKHAPTLNEEIQSKLDITGSDNGWITGEILQTAIEQRFFDHIDKIRNKQGLLNRWALLIVDNHSSRVSLPSAEDLEENKLKILFLPAHSSALIQPLDLGPNLALKQQYSRWYHPVENEDAPDRRNRQMDAVVTAISMATCSAIIKDAWLRTGMWPIRFEAIVNSKMIKPEVQQVPRDLKRKRGPRITGGNILVDGRVIVNSSSNEKENNPPNGAKTKKSTKKRKLSVNGDAPLADSSNGSNN